MSGIKTVLHTVSRPQYIEQKENSLFLKNQWLQRKTMFFFFQQSPVSKRHTVQFLLPADHGVGGRQSIVNHLKHSQGETFANGL